MIMDNFKFNLTNDQVCILSQILEEVYNRECHRVYVSRVLKGKTEFLDARFIDIATLMDEFNIQASFYLRAHNLNSFEDGNKSVSEPEK